MKVNGMSTADDATVRKQGFIQKRAITKVIRNKCNVHYSEIVSEVALIAADINIFVQISVIREF